MADEKLEVVIGNVEGLLAKKIAELKVLESLDVAVQDLKNLVSDKKSIEKNIGKLVIDQATEKEKLDKALSDVEKAQELAAKMIADAKAKADDLVNDAQLSVDKMVDDANRKAKAYKDKIQEAELRLADLAQKELTLKADYQSMINKIREAKQGLLGIADAE